MVSTINHGFANSRIHTTEPDKNQEEQQDQDGRRKSEQSIMRPDGQFAESSAMNPIQEVATEDQTSEQEDQESVDSLQDDSVSKYNFIFYFLYKFKYDSEESP